MEPMSTPDDRRYGESHEWHKLEEGHVIIGISRFAVDELTDITFVDFTRTDGHLSAGESFGEIESVKTTSELYTGIDGTIVEVNGQLGEDPSVINEDPYGRGWLIRLRPDDPSQLEKLLEAVAYDAHVGG